MPSHAVASVLGDGGVAGNLGVEHVLVVGVKPPRLNADRLRGDVHKRRNSRIASGASDLYLRAMMTPKDEKLQMTPNR